MTRTCPNGGPCPSPDCRYYSTPHWCVLDLPPGTELTQGETAAALGISARSVRRIEERLSAALEVRPELRAIARELLGRVNLSSGKADIFAPNVRIARELPQDGDHAPRGPEPDIAAGESARQRGSRGASVSKGIVEMSDMSIFGNLICAIADLRTRRFVTDTDRTRLTELARAGEVERFRSELARVESASREPDAEQLDALNAFELHKANPHLARFMRAAGVTKEQVIAHGPRASLLTRVVPNLRELAEATAATAERGDG